jgi:hypothetical protein
MRIAVMVIPALVTIGLMVCNSNEPKEDCVYDGYRLMTYSSAGLISKDEIFDNENIRYLYYTFNFDANDRMTSAMGFNNSGALVVCVNFVLDNAGNAIREVYSDKDSVLLFFYTNAFNANGDIVSGYRYAKDSTLLDIYKYTYDASGRSLSTEHYDANNTLIDTYVNKRNSDGLLVSATQYDANNKKLAYKNFTFSSQNNTVKITYYACAGSALLKMTQGKLLWDKPEPLFSPKIVDFPLTGTM